MNPALMIESLPALIEGARLVTGGRPVRVAAKRGSRTLELLTRAGVDVLSFGGTKNGCMGVEAVVLFDPAKSWELELRRKRAGHLFSKHRFLSAQMDAYFADDLWLDLAALANARAARLAAGLAALPGVTLRHPVEANIVFAAFPDAGHRALEAAGAQYYRWPAEDCPHPVARLVCGWSTSEAEIDRALAILAGALPPSAG